MTQEVTIGLLSATHHKVQFHLLVCCSRSQIVGVVDSYIQRVVLATEETAVIQQVSRRACGHKEVPRSTGHSMVTTRYSDQQGSKSRQKFVRLYNHWHRPMSKRFIKPLYSISRATLIDSDCCRLPTASVLSDKADKLRSNQI